MKSFNLLKDNFHQFSIMEKYAKLSLITKYPPYLFTAQRIFTSLLLKIHFLASHPGKWCSHRVRARIFSSPEPKAHWWAYMKGRLPSSVCCPHSLNVFSGWPLSQRQNSLTSHWLFPDKILFFPDQNTEFLRHFSLLAADKWKILFSSSLKCTSRILQFKRK